MHSESVAVADAAALDRSELPISFVNDTPIEPAEPAIQKSDPWAPVFYVAIFAGIGLLGYYQFNGFAQRLYDAAQKGGTLKSFVYPSLLWSAMGVLLLAFRTALWIVYRPRPAATYADAPPVTVIIPAYNEGPMVLQAIEAVARADYPRDRLQVIAIDDGSKDDTWHYIQQAALRHPELVIALKQPRNMGKREALALGFARAKGEIAVTIDSDSIIEPDALLKIVGPFRDPRIGSVAGKVLVYNRKSGIIPRMLHVRFVLAFDMFRSGESVFRNVYCCPGALTALRLAPVLKVMDRWRQQRFLGGNCTYGEDRALTNYLFEAGYDSVYQRTAVVRTEVPTTYSKLCRMLIRWDRSYVREEARFIGILWRRPWPTRVVAAFDRFIANLRFPVYYVSLVLLVQLGIRDPGVISRMLVAIGAVSLFNMLYYLRSERSLAFVWGVLYAYVQSFTLFWIFPYALLTVRSKSWLTR